MRYGLFILALGGLWSSQVSAGELQSVYVAPGGVYIASAHVHVGPETATRLTGRLARRPGTPRLRAGLCAAGAGIQSTGIL